MRKLAYVICNNSRVVLSTIIDFVENVDIHLEHCIGLIFPAIKEHFPRPVIEAFAKRKIAIASNQKGITEIIEDKVNGFLFESSPPKDLACKINMVNNLNNEQKEIIRTNGYKTYNEKFTFKNVKSIEKIITSLLNQ